MVYLEEQTIFEYVRTSNHEVTPDQTPSIVYKKSKQQRVQIKYQRGTTKTRDAEQYSSGLQPNANQWLRNYLAITCLGQHGSSIEVGTERLGFA